MWKSGECPTRVADYTLTVQSRLQLLRYNSLHVASAANQRRIKSVLSRLHMCCVELPLFDPHRQLRTSPKPQ